MIDSTLAVEKEKLRRNILQIRDRQNLEEIEARSARVVESVLSLSEYQRSRTIACYVSKGSEVRTPALIQEALSWGRRVLVPVVSKDARTLEFSEIHGLEELVPGTFGILEPSPEYRRITKLGSADVLFVPGIAWDINGYRLGWGKGYFDTVLKRLPDRTVAIGLAFDLQVVDRVPRAQFDLRVDLVVTETRVVHCHPKDCDEHHND